jgi:hypothetical protein
MPIQRLTSANQAEYATFRAQLWPFHAAAGPWEAAEVKYNLNPLSSICPGSGLYGYFEGERLCGIMGAHPWPVTVNGVVYPGHVLVDWAVLPALRLSRVTGHLWYELLGLPGRKYASDGAQAAQRTLQNRGKKIGAVQSFALIRPIRASAAKLLRFANYSFPGPFLIDKIEPYKGVQFIDGGQVRAAGPPILDKTAWINRGSDFWDFYCRARIYNGAIPLRIRSAAGEADLVIDFCETGPFFRFATLMSAQFVPYTQTCAASVGRLLRGFLKRLNVCVLIATEADAELSAFIKHLAWYVHRVSARWWSIPKDSDTFPHDSVSWWLTSADRDSHFGGLQPCTAL